MSENTDDGRRLMARGMEMTLANGSVHTVKFTSRAMARIEDDYGSLEAFTEVLKDKPFNSVAYVIHLTLGVGMDQALDLVDSKRVRDYFQAIGAAMEEALPEQPVSVRIVQDHEFEGTRYRAGTEVEVTSDRAKHLIAARVAVAAEADSGNAKAAPGQGSPGAAFSTSPSASGTSRRRTSGR